MLGCAHYINYVSYVGKRHCSGSVQSCLWIDGNYHDQAELMVLPPALPSLFGCFHFQSIIWMFLTLMPSSYYPGCWVVGVRYMLKRNIWCDRYKKCVRFVYGIFNMCVFVFDKQFMKVKLNEGGAGEDSAHMICVRVGR